MMIRGSAMMLFVGGVFLFMLAKMIPFLSYIFMDWIAVCMMGACVFILLFCFGVSQTGLQYDTIPAGSAIINYIRRDGIIAPLLGKRIFPGESFLDVPKLGIIEDVGTDTVLLWGRKKVRFGLENINYTPDPRYWNVCRELYHLGFDDTDDLFNILNIPNMNSKTDAEKAKKVYYMERMANIYWNMTHHQPRGADRLMTIFKKPRERNVQFGPTRRKNTQKDETRTTATPSVQEEKKISYRDVHDEIDRRLNR